MVVFVCATTTGVLYRLSCHTVRMPILVTVSISTTATNYYGYFFCFTYYHHANAVLLSDMDSEQDSKTLLDCSITWEERSTILAVNCRSELSPGSPSSDVANMPNSQIVSKKASAIAGFGSGCCAKSPYYGYVHLCSKHNKQYGASQAEIIP